MANRGLGNGLDNGLESGLGQGVDLGLRQGLGSGMSDAEFLNNRPMQNPLLLTGTKKPIIYGLADEYTQPDAVTTTLNDIANTGTTLSCNTGGSLRPAPTRDGALGTKYSMLYNNNQSYFATTTNVTLGNAYSFVMVCKLTGNTNCTAFHVDDTISVGGCDIIISATDNTLQSTFYGGSAGTITNSKYKTTQSPNVMGDWIVLSGTYKLNIDQGVGSEQKLYVNGMLQHEFVSSTFTVVTTTMGARQVIVGNFSTSAPSAAAGFKLGAFVMFDYYMNSMERMRIENYFRSYYGYNF